MLLKDYRLPDDLKRETDSVEYTLKYHSTIREKSKQYSIVEYTGQKNLECLIFNLL